MSQTLFRTILRGGLVAAALTVTSVANAQPNFFFSRSTFVAALSTTQTNDLNALPNGTTVISFGTLGTGTLAGATVSGGQITKPSSPFSFSITFSQLISGFGADFTNAVNPVGGSYSLFNGATAVGGGAVSFSSTNTGTFFGIIPSGGLFDRVVITDAGPPPSGTNTPSTFTSMDNLTVGVVAAVVPEPATVVLLATGLLAVGGVARRRTRTLA